MTSTNAIFDIPQNAACACIVAHPDDETLWAGGTILTTPRAQWHLYTLTRKSDPDRNPKFYRAAEQYHARAQMGDLDDSLDQPHLDPAQLEQTILDLTAGLSFHTILTHSPAGEYTRHRRHEETARAVITLCQNQKLKTTNLFCFAYTDRNRQTMPQPDPRARITLELDNRTWQKKYRIITDIYGFNRESFEAKTTPNTEAFWQIPEDASFMEQTQ